MGTQGVVTVVSSREAHVPDHLSCREDITLFAPIIPLSAEAIKRRELASGRFLKENDDQRAEREVRLQFSG